MSAKEKMLAKQDGSIKAGLKFQIAQQNLKGGLVSKGRGPICVQENVSGGGRLDDPRRVRCRLSRGPQITPIQLV